MHIPLFLCNHRDDVSVSRRANLRIGGHVVLVTVDALRGSRDRELELRAELRMSRRGVCRTVNA
jgi:hypothetical protein